MSDFNLSIDELIEQLEDARETLGGSAKVRVAYQQNYPLRGRIERVTVPEDDPYDEDEHASGQQGDSKMLWLALGAVEYGENPYGPRWAWTGNNDVEDL